MEAKKSVTGINLLTRLTREGGVTWQNDNETPYLTSVLFSQQAQFLVQFFSTQKRVNCDKTDFATKQRKLRHNRFCDKTA